MSNTMQAQVFLEAEKMEMRDVPIPRVGDADVLVRVKNCGICGSDISYFFMWSPPDKMPIILGHEFTGEVVEVGAIPKSMGLFKPGDRVVVNPVQHCNACYACAAGHTNLCTNMYVPGVNADGAFAEYALSRYTGLFKLDDAVTYAAGAFIEPLACAVYAMNKLEIEPGQFVAIFGPGPIGIMMTQIAKHTGAGKVAMIGTRDYRLEEAKKWGADYIFNTKDEKSPYYVKDLKAAIADVTHGKLADRAINPAGPNEAFEQAIDITGGGAILVHFGLPNSDDIIHVPADAFHKADKQIRASWLAPGVWPQTIAMIANGLMNLEPLVSTAVPLSQAAQAIVDLRARKGNPIKVQVTP